MSTSDRFVSIQQKRILGFLDMRDRFLDYIKAQLTQITAVAYGDDGTVGSTLTLADFSTGVDRFQISNDIIGSDGQGHFTLGTAELAGRDVGFQFANTLAVDYFVAYHYAERPRGIQINPRTGYPEFIELEETLGNSANPDLVTDNGNGTITFRVNSVARLYAADATLNQTGRRVLVWKKTPGRSAITESVAVELRTISLVSTHNVITTVGNFGQSTVSTLASDYTVLLLGASVSLEDLSAQIGYHFIGTITGAGTGVNPSYDATGQNVLGPLISDINTISTVHHGTRKIRVGADNSDVDETQIEARGRPDAGAPLVFSVDEDGDMFALGTARVDSFVGLGGAPESPFSLKTYDRTKIGVSHDTVHELRGIFQMLQTGGTQVGQFDTELGRLLLGIATANVATANLRVEPDAEIDRTIYLGTNQSVLGDDANGTTPRIDYGDFAAGTGNQTYILDSIAFSTSQNTFVRTFLLNNAQNEGRAITINANRINSTAQWDKDVDGLPAIIYEFSTQQFYIGIRLAANDADWINWDNRHRIDTGEFQGGRAEFFGDIDPVTTGQDLGNTSARWDLFAQAIDASGNITPAASGQDLGSAGNRWDVFAQAITASGNVLPDVSGQDLGSTSARWDLFASIIDASYALLSSTTQVPTATTLNAQHRTNLVRAWGMVNDAATLMSPHYNVESITNLGSGIIQVVLDEAPASYVVLATCFQPFALGNATRVAMPAVQADSPSALWTGDTFLILTEIDQTAVFNQFGFIVLGL